VITAAQLDHLDAHVDAPELRAAVRDLVQHLSFKQALIDKLTHENATLKRLKFAAKSEALNAEQKSLLEECVDADLEALAQEIEQATAVAGVEPAVKPAKQSPKRQALPSELPRREIHHEPVSTICPCGCAMQRIGEDVAEKLDYVPGTFSVERHIRGKWVCVDKACIDDKAGHQTVVQAPVPAHVIDKGIPTTSLLAQVLIAKYLDHLPLYRQEAIFQRAGHAIPRSTLGAWVGACGVQLQPIVDAMRIQLLQHTVLHADETPVAVLKPSSARDGKTHRAYLWSYCTTSFAAMQTVIFDFADSRAGHHARDFLGTNPTTDQGTDQGKGWRGTLICDDYAGYKACFGADVIEAGCMAHARRKFHELWANHQSPTGEAALKFFAQLYAVEQDVQALPHDERQRRRQERSRPIADALHQWLNLQRAKIPDGSATAKAIDYSLKRWGPLTRFIDHGQLPIDNNWVENQIRPIALGRKNWLFAGSLRAGQRAAAVMSLIHSARLNQIEPHAYLSDVLQRLPTQAHSRILELTPQCWKPNGI
jgi:transposase